jgi:hypothetical protein
MKGVRLATLAAVLCCVGVARGESVDGSVFLFPITDSFEFRSLGEAAYLDDLGQEDSGAVLSGTHSVHGPVVFEHPVQGSAGKHDYVLEGSLVARTPRSSSASVVTTV